MPQGQVHRETYMCNLPPSKKMLAWRYNRWYKENIFSSEV
jgi:hypothetical protein